VTHNHC